MAEVFKLYKLIVLYMLDKVDFPLTNSQISEFILAEGYMDYFKLQQVLAELAESGFVREEASHSRTFYHLTDEGAQTLHYFKRDISTDIQQDIDQFLHDKMYELKNEFSVRAGYYKNEDGGYSVCCKVIEHDAPLIELTLTVPSEAAAISASNNWPQKNQEIYAFVMQKLL